MANSPKDIVDFTNKLNETFAKQEAVAPVFNVTATYAVGDSVMYNGKLYTFTSAHSAGAWDPTEVDSDFIDNHLAGKADTTYVDTQLATKANRSNVAVIEDGSTSSAAYKIGDFIFRSSTFYRVKQPIAQGGSFTSSNIVSDRVGTQLSSKVKLSDLVLYTSQSSASTATATLSRGTYFYLDNVLTRALVRITTGQAFTAQNCVSVTNGALNDSVANEFTLNSSVSSVLEVTKNSSCIKNGTMFFNIRFKVLSTPSQAELTVGMFATMPNIEASGALVMSSDTSLVGAFFLSSNGLFIHPNTNIQYNKSLHICAAVPFT